MSMQQMTMDATEYGMQASKPYREIHEFPPVMLVDDVKEFTRLGTNKTYELLNHSKCPTRRFGSKITVYRDEFLEFYLNFTGGGA